MSSKLIDKIKTYLLKAIYYCYPTRYKKVIWLIGSGRSGTTWVASLINLNNTFRELFEPFHPNLKELSSKGFKYHYYLKNKKSNSKIFKISKRIFNGKFYHPRVEEGNKYIWKINYKNILVKDIYANLLAHKIYLKNKKIKPILIIRNPFEVSLSMKQKKHWDWMTNPSDFLDQDDLFRDFLQPHKRIIRKISKKGTFIDKQILIWAIINYIPLLQFNEDELLVTFYEDWISDPETELNRIQTFAMVNLPFSSGIKESKEFIKPSKTSSKEKEKQLNWKKKLTPNQIKSGEEILKHFNLEGFYNIDFSPNHEAVTSFRSKTTY